jgi:CRISPR system subtype II-B RNA-guided endonuclease Cas9/Csx12
MKKTFVISVGLDLGAKCTGVFIAPYAEGAEPARENCEALTFVNGENITYEMKERTAARHRVRGGKRFDLARRLLILIISQRLRQAGFEFTQSEQKAAFEAVFGLLKNRGFSRIETAVDLTVLEDLDSGVFAAYTNLDSFFAEDCSLAEQWENNKTSVLQVQKISAVLPKLASFKNFLKVNFKDELPDAKARKPYEEALKAIRSDAASILNMVVMGHKHRSKYFSAIRSDMKKDTRLSKVLKAFGGEERFANLVGNIANLQWRALHWYFNQPKFISGDALEEDRLHEVLVRAFEFFHPDPENSKKHQALMQKIRGTEDIIEMLCSLDPNETIPPYEDQNNRRPPVDQTLLLDPGKLQKKYGDKWKIWEEKLEKAFPELKGELDHITEQTDRKSRICINNKEVLPKELYRKTYFLQRVLDRSKTLNNFSLRRLADGEVNGGGTDDKAELTRVLGSQHVLDFVLFAQSYYDEFERAQNGLWLEDPDSLLEKSGLHPPAKQKILPILVRNVLRISENKVDEFLQNVWMARYAGKSTVLSACRNIEKIRKCYGGEFNQRYKRAVYLSNKGEKINSEEKELLKVKNCVEAVSRFLQGKLTLTDEEVSRFANPYSLAQLYTLIETERHGFSNTCLPVHEENAWRSMTTALIDGERVAQCTRLPADSVRPFDGVVRRTLDRQAWELTKILGDKIISSVTFTNGVVKVPFLAEANKFSFTASLYELKQKTEKIKKCEASAKRRRQQWADKDERIRRASKGLCPYTGIKLDKDGEVDHIISRSVSSDKDATVFDSEPNLFFVSPRGNQLKGEKRYFLSNLNSVYLKKIFGTADIKTIETRIETEIPKIQQENNLRYFELLSEEQQAYVRHALFLDWNSDARKIVIECLKNKRRALVNGTQAWFLRNVMEKLQVYLSDWKDQTGNQLMFRAWSCNVNVVHSLRDAVGKADPVLAKPDIQPVASHTVDAMCSFLSAGAMRRARNWMGGKVGWADPEQAAGLALLHPKKCRVIRIDALPIDKKQDIGSRAIFKEGIYGEEFLPIIVIKGVLYIGFDGRENNRIPVTADDAFGFLNCLLPFIDGFNADDKAALNEKLDAALKDRATFRINKQKAFNFLNEVQHREPTPQEETKAALLESLLYHTVHKNVVSVLTLQNGKTLKTEAAVIQDILNPKTYPIPVELKAAQWEADGTVYLPSVNLRDARLPLSKHEGASAVPLEFFKGGEFKGEFLPLLWNKGKLYIGFDGKDENRVAVTSKDAFGLLTFVSQFFVRTSKESFEKDAQNASEACREYRINKIRAERFLNEARRKNLSKQEAAQVSFLNTLLYFIVRKNRSDVSDSDIEFSASSEQLRTLSVKVENDGKFAKSWQANGSVSIPAAGSDCEILLVSELKDRVGSSLVFFEEGTLDDDFLSLIWNRGRISVGFDLSGQGKNSVLDIGIQSGEDPEEDKDEKKAREQRISLDLLKLTWNLLDERDKKNFDVNSEDVNKVKATFRFDKSRVLQFLNDSQNRMVTEQEQLLVSVMESLHYYLIRKDLASESASHSEFIKEFSGSEKFAVKVNLNVGSWSAKGILMLPAVDAWMSLLRNPKLTGCLGGTLDDFDLTACLAGIRGTDRKRDIQHARCRRIFSLPMVEAPSGGVRILRRSILGEKVFQTNSANAKFIGYRANGKKVQWKAPVLHPTFTTKNLTVLKEKYRASEDGFISLSQWRRVSDSFGVQIDMAPGSDGRRYIRVRINWPTFVDWVNVKKLKTPMDLKESIKADFTDKVPAELKDILGKPRSAFFIEEVGEIVQFRYIVVNSNDEMNRAYNAGS